jgi:hypothetical protein
MAKVIPVITMWLAWMFFALTAVATAHYCARGPGRNTFSTPFPVFAAGMLLVPSLICVGLRYRLSRIRRPWLALLMALFGILLSYLVEQFGIYIFPGLCIVFQILSGILFLVYWPPLVRLGRTPPPIPKALR